MIRSVDLGAPKPRDVFLGHCFLSVLVQLTRASGGFEDTLLLFENDKTLYAEDTCPSAAAASVSGTSAASCNYLKHKGLAVNVHKTRLLQSKARVDLPAMEPHCHLWLNIVYLDH